MVLKQGGLHLLRSPKNGLRLTPIEKVYLHRGTLEGARIILGKTTKEGVCPKEGFPSELHKLTAEQIETLLCVYKGKLKRLKTEGKI